MVSRACIVAVVGLVLLSGCGDDPGDGNQRTAATPRKHLTSAEICVIPQPVPCDQIDLLPPDKRAALEYDALQYLDGRTVAEANREAAAERPAEIARARAAAPPPGAGEDRSVGPGEIGRLPVSIAGFEPANMWLATDRLAGAKNSIAIWVGSASDDPDQGLVIRSADGDSVVNSTIAEDHPRLQPLPVRGRGAHIKSVNNRTGILTIAFANGRTLRYDGLHGKVVR